MTIDERVSMLEAKLRFTMQTLALTRTVNGQQESRSLTALYEEAKRYAGTTPQTLQDVASRTFGSSGTGTTDRRDPEPSDHRIIE